MDKISKNLLDYLRLTDKDKSSHWDNLLKNQINNIENLNRNFGFGSFENKNFIRSILHFILSRYLFGTDVFKTKEFKGYFEIFNNYNRQIDVDAIRHILTFKLLKSRDINPSKICVIGDGKANFVIGSYLNFPKAKIYSVNLAETLLHDYYILKHFNIFNESEIKVVNKKEDLYEEAKLYLIPSSEKNLIKNFDIELFINMVSFQEMKFEEIEKYFTIIKSNNRPYLYCCNREEKVLLGGEKLRFSDYPWGDAKKLFDEECSWHQYYYRFRFPFIKKYDGKILHSLVKF